MVLNSRAKILYSLYRCNDESGKSARKNTPPRVLEGFDVKNIAVLDEKGIVIYNVIAPEIEGPDFSWRRYYREAKRMTPDDGYIIQILFSVNFITSASSGIDL